MVRELQMRGRSVVVGVAFVVFAAMGQAAALAADAKPADTARGRYLVQIGGCNDCHTAGYTTQGGKVPEAQWLTGDALGWRGPWGTTYPSNLRLYFAKLSEADWLKAARSTEWRPPMPWFNLRAMSDADLRAIYRYIKAAGPAGQPAPTYLPPGQVPSGPVVQFP
jgi:mono/diheme cytochrome c family protein